MERIIYKETLAYRMSFKDKERESILLTEREKTAIYRALEKGVRRINVWEAGEEEFDIGEIEMIRPLDKKEKARLARERWYYRRSKFLYEEKRWGEVGKVYLFELIEVRETEERLTERVACRDEVWEGPQGEFFSRPRKEFIF